MDGIFGSRLRSDVLIAVARLGTTYASELAGVLKKRPIEIQRALRSLERAGLVTTRRVGRVRLVDLDRRYPESPEMAMLLLKLSERPLYRELWGRTSRRPRAMGKTPR
jgi:DNA-binding transcriptional ArsR family regulator